MSDQFVVSALKYRPQTFDTVVGQSHITTTLKNAIRSNHLAHAFLFCGPRGVGKTTCARILARTINCTNRTADEEACGTCESCTSFRNNTSFNVHELDAASNNSVEDIRSLIEQVRFAPQSGKYKVYIIDEVHMLSTAAFNAFLKTLEEPPSYAIFILATTEKHKILPTILSRCQIFDFNRITIKDTVDHLDQICQRESTLAERDALHLIAQKSEGCMRDSLSIMDKIVSFTSGNLTFENTLEHLNILDYDYFFKITDALLAEDLGQVMLLYDEIVSKGFEGDNFLDGFAEHFRTLLMCKDIRIAKLMEVSNNLKKRYYDKATQISNSFILSALNVLNDAIVNYRQARNKRLHVEMALIKLCHIHQAIILASSADGQTLKKKLTEHFQQIVPPSKAAIAQPIPVRQQPPAPQPQAMPQPAASNNYAPADYNTQPAAAVQEPRPATYTPAPTPAHNPVAQAPQATTQTAPPPPMPQQTTTATATSAPKTTLGKNGLQSLLQKVKTDHENSIEASGLPLNADNLHECWHHYLQNLKILQKSSLHTNLSVINISVTGPEDITMDCPSTLAYTFANAERLALIDYLQQQFGNKRLKVYIKLNELAPEQQVHTVMSKSEIFAAMVEKNPLLKELKDGLNLELDYM